MTVIFFGTSSFGLPALEALARSRHTLKAIISTPNKPRGRNLKVQASPIKQWAMDHDFLYHDFFKEHPSQLLLTLKELNADIFVVVSFGVLLKKEVLELPRLMPINVHASLLPKYRGASPMQAAILNEDGQTGITIMRMVERLDAGEILLKNKFLMDSKETIENLAKRLSILAAQSMLEALDALEKGAPVLTPQEEKEASYTQKITKEDGRINWRESANKIDAKVRAYRGWPGTFFFLKGKRIILCKAQAAPAYEATVPGTVLKVSGNDGILVSAGAKTLLKLEELQVEGRRDVGWKEFVRGFPLKAGELLE